ncbi:zinc ABC transporter substrate-binding protein [bacterium BFN5]|nr:zinc ABC transporter substrate-binding protein [bacterium BFN5]
MKVVTTIYPVYEFVRQVGGDKVEVTMLLKPGVEPHDWEPTARELAEIKKAKVFFYHGAGLEPVDRLLTQEVLGTAQAVEVSKGIERIFEQEDADEHEHEQQTGHTEDKHHHDEIDVHTWLDPENVQHEVNVIAEALAAADSKNRDYYLKNAETYNLEIARLDQEFKSVLAKVTRRDIITSHAAFGYLAKRYNLHQLAVMGLSPDSEPTPDKMAQIVDFCRDHNVKYIFFETLVSPKLSQTIAKETGADLLVLNPIESLTEAEIKQGKNYLIIMRENLENLKKALN